MTPTEQKTAARDFAAFWTGKGYEKGQTQPFWLSLLRVLGVEHPERFIEFEDKAHIDARHGFIDDYIPATHVLIEQKSLGRNLRAGIPQSDGSVLTPFQQAKRYAVDLPYSRRPRFIVVSNFAEFDIYDMENPNGEPERLLLKDLPRECYRLRFLVDTGSDSIRREEEVSKKAGDVVGLIYDALLKQYRDPTKPQSLKSLNELCVRLVFLLYAEDADVFTHLQFHDYLKRREARDARRALIDLFRVLDTPPEKRDPYLDEELAAFPYVNGGLFANENIEIPQFTDEILDLVLRKGSEDFDWKDISPTIFGAVFESTLNPDTRRSGGMHYTSVQNIHKVIDPLFLDGLRAELAAIKGVSSSQFAVSSSPATATSQPATGQPATSMKARLRAFIDGLASLTFLDPACGSGNFLTETYICLRRLENEALAALLGNEMRLDLGDLVKVSISQFHGIEINDFAVAVAKTALWIAENQMLRETERIAHRNIDFLPLKSYDGIVEGNALRIEWNSLLSANGKCKMDNEKWEVGVSATNSPSSILHSSFDYIMGNPPFIGARWMGTEQKKDVLDVFGSNWSGVGDLDYVCCWFKKATDYMGKWESRRPGGDEAVRRQDGCSPTRSAFVATNSITQGNAPANLWKGLFTQGVSIDFAHRTFRWDSESNSKAHVHCVVVGFSCDEESLAKSVKDSSDKTLRTSREDKLLFDGDRAAHVTHINAYLLPGDDVFVKGTGHPICNAPETGIGNKPIDNGEYLFTDDEKTAFLAKEPEARPYFHPWYGADELINGRPRHCLWLGDCEPDVLRALPECRKRVAAVRDYRLASKSAPTRKLAERPTRFHVENMPKGDYIVIPEVSSERRRYVPIGYLSPDVLCSNKLRLLPGATPYHFGVLTSNVHMAWMRAVCCRLETRYSYSVDIVYNCFPWPGAEANSGAPVHLCVPAPVRERIERTAQGILDARAAHPSSSLADLYDELTMPPDLRKAHQDNDRAVMAAYGFKVGMTESECVAELFKRYQALVEERSQERTMCFP